MKLIDDFKSNVSDFFSKTIKATEYFNTFLINKADLDDLLLFLKENNSMYKTLKNNYMFQEPNLLTMINKSMNKIAEFLFKFHYEPITIRESRSLFEQIRVAGEFKEISTEYVDIVKIFSVAPN